MHLWRSVGPSQQALADSTDRDKPTIARMVDVLEKRGLVTNNGRQSDGRIKQVFLTESGMAARAGLLAGSRVALEDALGGIESEDLQATLSFLERMRANLESLSNEDLSRADESIPPRRVPLIARGDRSNVNVGLDHAPSAVAARRRRARASAAMPIRASSASNPPTRRKTSGSAMRTTLLWSPVDSTVTLQGSIKPARASR
ncbi:MAG: MarR family winged helix-turn-helix transcriptional regulator, partial [Thermoflexales bacterium]